MKRIKLFLLTISVFLTLSSYSQISLGLHYNYLTNNNEATNWGFTIHPEYKISHQVRVGLSTSIFLNPNPFPDYLEFSDNYINPNIVAATAHRLLPIDATFKYYFNKKAKQRLQPHIQVNAGVAILGTFTNAEIKNLSYVQYIHEVDNYFSIGFRVGTDYKLLEKLDFTLDAGYSRVFNDAKNRFENAPSDLSNYNSYFNHYFLFSAGLKYNFN